MRNVVFALVVSFFFVFSASEAVRAEWTSYSGMSPQGGTRVAVMAEESSFRITLECDSGADPEVFQLTFVADDFPHLDNTDSVETQLMFRFDGTNKAFAEDGWSDVWYFSPDKAWTGSVYFSSDVLDSFGAASVMRVLNMEGEEVTRFSMKGSRKAEKTIRALCHEGRSPEQWAALEAEQQAPANNSTAPEDTRVEAVTTADTPLPILAGGELRRVGDWQIGLFPQASPPAALAQIVGPDSKLLLRCEAGDVPKLQAWLSIRGTTAQHGLELDFDLSKPVGRSFHAYGVLNPQSDGSWFGDLDMRAPDFRAFGLADTMRVGAAGAEPVMETPMRGSEAVFHAMRLVCNLASNTTSEPDPDDCGSPDLTMSIAACTSYIAAQTDAGKLALAYGIRGHANERAEDGPGALDDQDMTIRLDPDQGRYWSIRAEHKVRLGDIAGAIADLEHAVARLPGIDQIVARLAELRGSVDDTESVTGDNPPVLPPPMAPQTSVNDAVRQLAPAILND